MTTAAALPRREQMLEAAAHRAQEDGDPVRAVTTLLRSADVTPPGPDRAAYDRPMSESTPTTPASPAVPAVPVNDDDSGSRVWALKCNPMIATSCRAAPSVLMP